ncbi:hypothetical protein [Micavibrio aeruginosavorus]|uniref:hypothetical protein n=1 Tax=Micavibrio aeruginosavorus TaxID=349221 RepID=UPI003F4A9154
MMTLLNIAPSSAQTLISRGLRACLIGAVGAGLLWTGFASQAAAQSAFDDPGRNVTSKGGVIGDLTPVQPNVDTGQISLGSTAQVVVLFRNDSGRPLQTGAINLYPSSSVSASVAINECQGSSPEDMLPPGAVCAIGLSVKGLQAGRFRVEMLMRHSGTTRLVTATVVGDVQANDDDTDVFRSDIEAIPTELDFEDVDTSQPVVKPVVFRNITSEAIDVEAIYVEAADQSGISFRTDCAKLGPGQACIVSLIWSPILRGQVSGVLVVEHSGPTSVASVPILGEFDPEDLEQAKPFPEAIPGKGLLVSSQEEINFETGVSTSSAMTVSLVNAGDVALTLNEIRLSNTDTGLSISKNGCATGMMLEPVQACPLTVVWNPVREGAILDDIQIAHDGARGILVLPVRGTASGIVSKDNQAVRLSETVVTSSSGESRQEIIVRDNDIDPATVLDGFAVTSHSPKRAIITGPGGSRIVFNGEEVVIGGFLWNVNIRSSGVEFQSGDEKVLLLFDRALSSNSVNVGSGRSSSSTTSSSTSAPSTSTTPTQ